AEQEKISIASPKIRIIAGRNVEGSIHQLIWSFTRGIHGGQRLWIPGLHSSTVLRKACEIGSSKPVAIITVRRCEIDIQNESTIEEQANCNSNQPRITNRPKDHKEIRKREECGNSKDWSA